MCLGVWAFGQRFDRLLQDRRVEMSAGARIEQQQQQQQQIQDAVDIDMNVILLKITYYSGNHHTLTTSKTRTAVLDVRHGLEVL